jgi:hypothetical protein
LGNRRFESISLQRGVRCEPDFGANPIDAGAALWLEAEFAALGAPFRPGFAVGPRRFGSPPLWRAVVRSRSKRREFVHRLSLPATSLPTYPVILTKPVGLIAIMAVVFAISTITTYVLLCVYWTAGLQRVRLGAFKRYGEVLSGPSSRLSGWCSGFGLSYRDGNLTSRVQIAERVLRALHPGGLRYFRSRRRQASRPPPAAPGRPRSSSPRGHRSDQVR